MKVLKFGGTSVGSVESMLNLRQIVESEADKQPVIVVVSALGGITDKLISTARVAMQGKDEWESEFKAIVERHHNMISDMITDANRREKLLSSVDSLLTQLHSIYLGVSLIRDLGNKTLDTIVSYGERISSQIVATLIENSKWFDSRSFIKTVRKNHKNILNSDLTDVLIKKTFAEIPRISLVPGFISSDTETNDTTNLGRGGSDYTAAIIAAALDAEVLEIWTDVDGFMTADPKVIKTAYTIDELSYIEAMELCNFGAKVIYPPTIYPVLMKNIPIKVKNTFNISGKGTIIKKEIADDQRFIKGISSINHTTIITVTGLSMVGVVGVNRRIFTALANNGISVFMVSQTSSENSTSIGVRDEDAKEAVRVLDEEFEKEIEAGAMSPMNAESGLATIAIVGEKMRNHPGISGRLFGTLGRSGINVIASAQGARQTNISFVVESKSLRKALNVLHDSFFLSEYKILNLFVCGVGTVGGMLIEQIRSQYESLKQNRRLKLNVVGIASSRHAIFNRDGLNLENYADELKYSPESNTTLMCDEVIGMNIFNSVFVDCTASQDVASLYKKLLDHNISVVAANKIAASSEYDNYSSLKHTALSRGVKYLFETNVGAGLPIIGTINDLINSGDKILRIKAVLSGTLNYIFNVLSKDIPFSKAVELAKENGYSEPDPRIDLSGTDVIRKLVILTREAGYKIDVDDVEKQLFIPDDFFKGTVEQFWDKLPTLDKSFEQKRKQLETEGRHWRFIAAMDHGKAKVSLETVDSQSPFYTLEGSNNIILLTTERYREYPMMIQGYGAGAEVTAAGVFANIMSIANI